MSDLTHLTADSPGLPFVKFPKFLLAFNISLSAKLVYALLLDRAELSKANSWANEQGRVYVVCSIQELSEMMGKKQGAVKLYLSELEEAGLIERQRAGFAATSRTFLSVPIESKNQPSLGQDSDHHTDKNLTVIGSKSCLDLYNVKNKTYRTRQEVDIFIDFAKDNEELLDALKAFNEMRTKIKKPMTDRAKTLLCKKLEKEFPPGDWVATLNESVLHGWQSVYPLKTQQQAAQLAAKEVEWIG